MAFDDRATSGFGRGEGAGSIILKSLEEALRDGDNVRAVIRNSGSNQDGRTPGITMPSRDAQVSLIRSVYRSAGLDPLETGFVEAHGTGTAIGDPIEASAIGEVFGRPINTTPLYVGSLKSNIGHLEGTSGVVSIIKTVLMLEKGFVLPNCDFKITNPEIPMAHWNMKVDCSL
jgi:acyl transferase domain-containing protein